MLVAYAAAKRGPPVGRIRTAAEALPAPNRQPNSRQPNSPSRPGEIRRRSRWPPVGAHPVKPKRCAGGLPRMRWPCGNARLPSNHSGAPRCASHQTRRSAAPKRGTSLRKLRRRSRVSLLAHAWAQRRRETSCLCLDRRSAADHCRSGAVLRLLLRPSPNAPTLAARAPDTIRAGPQNLVRRQGLQAIAPARQPSRAIRVRTCARPGRPPAALRPRALRFTYPLRAR